MQKMTLEFETVCKYQDEIVELVDNQSDYTRSDMQSRAMVIAMNLYNAGKKDNQ